MEQGRGEHKGESVVARALPLPHNAMGNSEIGSGPTALLNNQKKMIRKLTTQSKYAPWKISLKKIDRGCTKLHFKARHCFRCI